MMRNFNATATPSIDLRRRHQAQRDYSFHWDSEVAQDLLNPSLDLSVHRSSSPFNREFHVTNSRRRPRDSRGTKEAKKRRDARRNRRKLTAQYLNEQLSKDIDETLNKANIRPPQPVSLPTPPPVLPTSSFWPSQPQQNAFSARRSPSPFQLPPLEFNAFDVHDFPLLASPKQSPPLSPQPFLAGVPNWCPKIPCLAPKLKRSPSWPKFFDLSHLPEQKSLPEHSTGKELQLWQGDVKLHQRKESRFFPRQPSPRPTVKLPSTYCTLHRSKIDANDVALTDETVALRPRSISDAVREIVAAVMSNSSTRLGNEPSAVNLWNILSEEVERKRHVRAGDRESSLEDESHVAGGVLLNAESNEAYHPAGLESNEIPYTHENSLIGFANEVAELHSGTGREDLLLADSAMYLAEAISRVENEPTDYELAAMPWPQTPATPFEATSDPSTLWVEADTNTDSDDMTDSIAHYTSEQQLFDLEPSKPETTTGNTCDLETFLSMGHVENCWCRDCEEEPELINDESSTPLIESDGWMIWAATEVESDDASEPNVPTDNDGKEEDGSFQTWTTAGFDWDDFYPSMTPQGPAPELDDEFLGFYDDGAAFSHDSAKDWMWGS